MVEILEMRPWAGALIVLALVFWVGRELRLWLDRQTGGAVGDPETPSDGAAIEQFELTPRMELADAFACGVLLVHFWLLALDVVSIQWQAVTVLLAPAGLSWWLGRRRRRRDSAAATSDLDKQLLSWGDWVAVSALAVFAWSAFTLRSLAPDFIYHWGIKGRRAFEVAGIDWEFLARPAVGYLHPDYPLLLSNIYGASARLGGAWREAPLMMLSVVALGLLVLEVRRLLADARCAVWLQQAGTAITALVLSGFSMAHEQAGAADILFALCMTGAARQLLRLVALSPSMLPLVAIHGAPQTSSRLGMWAAVALATKIEGAPLTLFIVGAGLLWHLRGASVSGGFAPRLFGWINGLAKCWRLWMPSAIVGLWWVIDLRRYDLLQPSNLGMPTWDRVKLALGTTPEALSFSTWSGFSWLVVLIPMLLAIAVGFRAAPVAVKIRYLLVLPLLQMLFYYFTYSGAPQDTRFWVLSSLPRLVFHVMPLTVSAVLIALDALSAGGAVGQRSQPGSPTILPTRKQS